MARILLLEDEETLRFSVKRALELDGHDVTEFESTDAAHAHVARTEVDAVLTDVNLADNSDGIEFAKDLRSHGFDGPIVVMTGYASVEQAVAAMKLGVDDYLQKPVVLEEVTMLIARLLEARKLRTRVTLYERLDRARADQQSVLGESEAWRKTLELAERLASLPIPEQVGRGESLPTVLILGETGVGKGVLARYIHECAQRGGAPSETPLVHVNCTALPPTLIESELFGHEKGAFTDAKTARKGLFEIAGDGTIFLDEIGDMPLELQAKILTVVEEGRYRRVGGTKEHTVRARIITATNVDLEDKVRQGSFRADLFYRLNTFTVSIPPLRERDGDALRIAQAMLERLARQYGRDELTLSEGAARAIAGHVWPGNVRELINILQRAALLARDTEISASDLGLASTGAGSGVVPESGQAGEMRFDFESGECSAENVERELIVQALQHTFGNVSKASRLLGMQRSSLRYRIDRFGLESMVKELASK